MKIVTSRDAAGGVIDNQPEQLCTQLELHLNGWCRFMVALEPVTPILRKWTQTPGWGSA